MHTVTLNQALSILEVHFTDLKGICRDLSVPKPTGEEIAEAIATVSLALGKPIQQNNLIRSWEQ